jgi:2-keto-4-pentenoate hydratase/2-oxohepta-3-ene-1,7-dioic acid hydratase in catechol pathway
MEAESVTNQGVTRYCRYVEGGQTYYGVIDGETVQRLDGDYLTGGKPTGQTARLADVTLALPVDPARVRKVIGVEYNYPKPGEPRIAMKHPSLFPKFHTSLVGEGAAAELPAECQDPHMGATMVVVIGKEGRNISLEDAPSHVFGVMVGNDVTDGKGYGRGGGLFSVDRMLGKANDTWGPIGSTMVTGLNYNDLGIVGRLNGQVAQEGRTSEMLTNVAKLIYYTSHYITLEPGDLLFTGYPAIKKGLRTIKPGDVMEVELEGAGKVTNTVAALEGVANPWWEKVYAEAAALPEHAEDVKLAVGPIED